MSNAIIHLGQKLYYDHYIPFRINQLRKQETIKVVFVLTNLGAWKTESLYTLMLTHSRFEPSIIISKDEQEDDTVNLRNYIIKKGYDYIETDLTTHILWEYIYPDIVFYQKPYRHTFPDSKTLLKYHKTLFCYAPYAFRSSTESWAYDWQYIRTAWQVYYENNILAKQYNDLLKSRHHNSYATGLPMMNELLIDPSDVTDQWKDHKTGKKRIIYAPHHSIFHELWKSATFLETGEEILRLAEKYSDKVQWAFKPHPLLRNTLEKVWTKERVDTYYRKWTDIEWSQYETGKYLGLFMHSDAMIHDCGSFIMEYLYTGNPVLYLMNDPSFSKTWNATYRQALSLHYQTSNIDGIENFINDVLTETDPLKTHRDKFRQDYLTPPGNHSAAQNIIECILNEKKSDQFLVY